MCKIKNLKKLFSYHFKLNMDMSFTESFTDGTTTMKLEQNPKKVKKIENLFFLVLHI